MYKCIIKVASSHCPLAKGRESDWFYFAVTSHPSCLGVHRRTVRRRAAGLVQVRGVRTRRWRYRRHTVCVDTEGFRPHDVHQEHVSCQVPKGKATPKNAHRDIVTWTECTSFGSAGSPLRHMGEFVGLDGRGWTSVLEGPASRFQHLQFSFSHSSK